MLALKRFVAGAVEGSLAIAQWADQHSSRQSETLFPPELANQILK